MTAHGSEGFIKSTEYQELRTYYVDKVRDWVILFDNILSPAILFRGTLDEAVLYGVPIEGFIGVRPHIGEIKRL